MATQFTHKKHKLRNHTTLRKFHRWNRWMIGWSVSVCRSVRWYSWSPRHAVHSQGTLMKNKIECCVGSIGESVGLLDSPSTSVGVSDGPVATVANWLTKNLNWKEDSVSRWFHRWFCWTIGRSVRVCWTQWHYVSQGSCVRKYWWNRHT